MKELSLNILDIAENSVHAHAKRIEIGITERDGLRTLTITDDGCGIPPEILETVTDPFTTSRTTRPVGMGLPLLKLAAEQAEGSFSIVSSQGEADHGTSVTASFKTDHIDCVPVGDLASTLVTLVQGSPDIDFVLTYGTDKGEKRIDTAEMREILGPDVPLDTPSVLVWLAEAVNEPIEETE